MSRIFPRVSDISRSCLVCPIRTQQSVGGTDLLIGNGRHGMQMELPHCHDSQLSQLTQGWFKADSRLVRWRVPGWATVKGAEPCRTRLCRLHANELKPHTIRGMAARDLSEGVSITSFHFVSLRLHGLLLQRLQHLCIIGCCRDFGTCKLRISQCFVEVPRSARLDGSEICQESTCMLCMLALHMSEIARPGETKHAPST